MVYRSSLFCLSWMLVNLIIRFVIVVLSHCLHHKMFSVGVLCVRGCGNTSMYYSVVTPWFSWTHSNFQANFSVFSTEPYGPMNLIPTYYRRLGFYYFFFYLGFPMDSKLPRGSPALWARLLDSAPLWVLPCECPCEPLIIYTTSLI